MPENPEDCYNCKQISQYFFSCLTIYFMAEYWNNRPYFTVSRRLFYVFPCVMFGFAAGYSRLECMRIRKNISKELNNE